MYYIYILMNISKHETQSLYPSLLHPRDSKPSSFDSATVCGSACPGGRLRGNPEVTGSAICLKKIMPVAANQRHSSNADAKPLRYLQRNLSLTFNKKKCNCWHVKSLRHLAFGDVGTMHHTEDSQIFITHVLLNQGSHQQLGWPWG